MHAQHGVQWQRLQPCTLMLSMPPVCMSCDVTVHAPFVNPRAHAQAGMARHNQNGRVQVPASSLQSSLTATAAAAIGVLLGLSGCKDVSQLCRGSGRQNCQCRSRFELRALLPARDGTRAARQRLGTASEGWEGRVPTETCCC